MAELFHEQLKEKEILLLHDTGHLLGVPGVTLFLPA